MTDATPLKHPGLLQRGPRLEYLTKKAFAVA